MNMPLNKNAVTALAALRAALEARFPPPPQGNARQPSPLQLLFEQWVSRDHWLLETEALPLLVGVDPASFSAQVEALDAADLVADCIAALGRVAIETPDLPLLNPTQPACDWRLAPADVYAWSVNAGYRVPEPYATLVQFVLQVVKRPELARSSPAQGAGGSGVRERVLGAAVALLSRTPQSCRDELGIIDPRRMAGLIAQQSIRWFDSPTPPLPIADMAVLIAEWTD